MTVRLPITVAVVVLAGALGAGPAAAQDAREIRQTIRDSVRQSVRDAVRDSSREVGRAMRDVSRAMREVGRSLRHLDHDGDSALAIRLDTRDELRVRLREVLDARVRVRLHGAAALALRQSASADPCEESRSWGDDEDEQVCEVRESTLPAGALSVDAGQNGGIRVEAWDRNEIRVRAIVRTSARSEERARALAGEVEVLSGSGRVSARGPATSRRESWSVSYRISVPRTNDLDLDANNGGITIAGVTGDIRFETRNGGVNLSDLAGTVRGRTRNGGLHVVLAGNRWSGSGLDVETTNGGVSLDIPAGYNAELETRTVNGGFRTDFPITVQGDLSFRRGVSTTLGDGGPPVKVRTTNGGLRISRR
ncbi:MAG: DUF4097 domain-containing protein [Vicinamibacterales bacterium]